MVNLIELITSGISGLLRALITNTTAVLTILLNTINNIIYI